MERRRRIRQAVALVIAVALVTTFVIYRATGTSYMGGSKSNPAFKMIGSPPPDPQPQPPQEPPEYLGGSKSTFIFSGNGVKPPEPPKPNDKKPTEQPVPDMTPPAKPGE